MALQPPRPSPGEENCANWVMKISYSSLCKMYAHQVKNIYFFASAQFMIWISSEKLSALIYRFSFALLSGQNREESQMKVIGKDLCVCSQRVYSSLQSEKYGSPFVRKKLGHGTADDCVGDVKLLRSSHYHNDFEYNFPLFVIMFYALCFFVQPYFWANVSFCERGWDIVTSI